MLRQAGLVIVAAFSAQPLALAISISISLFFLSLADLHWCSLTLATPTLTVDLFTGDIFIIIIINHA